MSTLFGSDFLHLNERVLVGHSLFYSRGQTLETKYLNPLLVYLLT